MSRDYRKLDAFRVADELAILVYELTRQFPKEELFGLTSQMRRAAVSAPSNIVEGSAKSSDRDFARFLEIAFGSLRELSYQASLAARLGYLADENFERLEEKCDHAARLVSRLLDAVRTD